MGLKNLTSKYPVTDGNEVIYNNRHYTNVDAVSNLINFILRGEVGEEVLGWGVMGAECNMGLQTIIQQFLQVQNFYHIESRRGRRMYHEVFEFSDADMQ